MAEYLYIAGAPEGPIKIGFTSNPRNRIGAIRNASPVAVQMLHCCLLDEPAEGIERTLHFVLRDKRLNGEWFSISAQDAYAALRKTAELSGTKLIDAMPDPTAAKATRQSRPVRTGMRGRPSSGKVVVTIRLDPAVIARFKTPVEKGWQSRINEALKAVKV